MNMKIQPEHIEQLMQRVKVTTISLQTPVPHVIANAWLDNKFLLSTAVSKTVDPKEFKEELGVQYSTKDALALAKNKLWELEGYLLKTHLDQAEEQVKPFE